MYFSFKKNFSFILLLFLYLSIIFGFVIGEDLNGGAAHDYLHAYKPIIERFSNNFHDTFLKYDQYGQRHSPILIILLSFLYNILENDTLIRLVHLHLSLFLIVLFFYSLRLRFKFLNNNIAAIIASVIFISPTFRSLAIWPDSRLFGLLFFVLSLIFFLKFKEAKKNSFYYCLLNIFFLSFSSYISPNFSIFSIYFFYYFARKFNYKKIFIIVIFNLFLAFPAFYYLFILKIFFLTSGKTPGFDGAGVAFDFNFANKILLISTIIFFHLINFILEQNMITKIKFFLLQKKYLILIILFEIILILNFNYKKDFTGGGIFFHLSYFFFNNNYLLYFFSFFSLLFIFSLIFGSFNNFLLYIILIISNIQLSIYHKYYEPLILIIFILLFESVINFKKFFNNKKNIFYLYSLSIIFFIFSIVKKTLIY
jgi:hypothetical protein